MVPTQPVTRVSVATYDVYEHAQRAVDFLSDEKFPVERVQIVGTDLRMVEQVVGRLNWWRAIVSGAATGAWIGLFVGLLMSILVRDLSLGNTILTGLLNGLVFGAVFAAVSYALSGGRRDFVSRSRIVPTRYDVLVETSHADQARDVLARLPAAPA